MGTTCIQSKDVSKVTHEVGVVAPAMADLIVKLGEAIRDTKTEFVPPDRVNTLILNVCIGSRVLPDRLPAKLFELYTESKQRERIAAQGGELRPYGTKGLLRTVDSLYMQLSAE